MTVKDLIGRLNQFNMELPILFATSWREPRFEVAGLYEHYDIDRHSDERVLFIDLRERQEHDQKTG